MGQIEVLENVVAEQARKGLRPATLKELLAFAEIYPNLQRDYIIVALGSSCMLMSEPDRSYYFNRNFNFQLNPTLEMFPRKILQTFWPFLNWQGAKRLLDIGQINAMRRYDLRPYVACFVIAE